MLTMQVVPGFAATCTGSINGQPCTGTLNYQSTIASGSTAMDTASGNVTVYVETHQMTSAGQSDYTVKDSKAGIHAATVNLYNKSSYDIVGAKSTHTASFGSGKWSDELSVGYWQ